MTLHLVSTPYGIGRVVGDEVELVELPYPDIGALLRERESLAEAATAGVRKRLALSSVPLRSPLLPRKMWGVGLNYRTKAATTGRTIPSDPILYLKAPSAIADPGDVIYIPSLTNCVDYEGEIAVVIGRRATNIDASHAWDHVAGITAANDLTARDVMKATGNPSLAKSFDGFAPLGASLLAVAGGFDFRSVSLCTAVNGDLRQQASSADLIFTVPELLARLSRYASLLPGDVLLTGTPSGTGEDLMRFLRPGDVVTVTVDGVLPLENTIGTNLNSGAWEARSSVSVLPSASR